MLIITSEDLAYAESLGIKIFLEEQYPFNMVLVIRKDTKYFRAKSVFLNPSHIENLREVIDKFNEKFNFNELTSEGVTSVYG